ncbi:MAG: hypothetical protein CVU39_10655 [Chloroflexi bacterium HGW-Chloroflexi-10]|nr:MAG: hypothetical protein CVU39_10655 [Chloroflexi bacterium HGW-Chloroflexi-10]
MVQNLKPGVLPGPKCWPDLTIMYSVTQTDRNLAALAHAAILIPSVGFIVPVLIWTAQRSRSAYAAQQALQALVYQMLLVVFVQVVLLLEGLLLIPVIGLINRNGSAPRAVLAAVGIALVILLLCYLLYLLLAVAAAVFNLLGRDWNYPWIGRPLRRYLLQEGVLVTEHEERVAASMAHCAFFYPTTGLLVPVGVWALLKNSSTWLRYQVVQAATLQAGWLIVSTLLTLGEVALSLPLLVPLFTSPDALLNLRDPRVLVTAVAGGMGLISVILFLVGPLLAVFATIAAIRMLQGQDYDYPILGKKIRNRLLIS